jgi:hypothetical protein
MTTIKGTIEVLTGNDPDDASFGFPVKATAIEALPGTAIGLGYSDIQPTTPRDGAEAEWTALHPEHGPVSIVLWRETAFDEVLIGKALAIAREELAHGPE